MAQKDTKNKPQRKTHPLLLRVIKKSDCNNIWPLKIEIDSYFEMDVDILIVLLPLMTSDAVGDDDDEHFLLLVKANFVE